MRYHNFGRCGTFLLLLLSVVSSKILLQEWSIKFSQGSPRLFWLQSSDKQTNPLEQQILLQAVIVTHGSLRVGPCEIFPLFINMSIGLLILQVLFMQPILGAMTVAWQNSQYSGSYNDLVPPSMVFPETYMHICRSYFIYIGVVVHSIH